MGKKTFVLFFSLSILLIFIGIAITLPNPVHAVQVSCTISGPATIDRSQTLTGAYSVVVDGFTQSCDNAMYCFWMYILPPNLLFPTGLSGSTYTHNFGGGPAGTWTIKYQVNAPLCPATYFICGITALCQKQVTVSALPTPTPTPTPPPPPIPPNLTISSFTRSPSSGHIPNENIAFSSRVNNTTSVNAGASMTVFSLSRCNSNFTTCDVIADPDSVPADQNETAGTIQRQRIESLGPLTNTTQTWNWTPTSTGRYRATVCANFYKVLNIRTSLGQPQQPQIEESDSSIANNCSTQDLSVFDVRPPGSFTINPPTTGCLRASEPSVNLSWTASANVDPINRPLTDYYMIFRFNLTTLDWEYAGISFATAFIDQGARPSTTYAYLIAAFNQAGVAIVLATSTITTNATNACTPPSITSLEIKQDTRILPVGGFSGTAGISGNQASQGGSNWRNPINVKLNADKGSAEDMHFYAVNFVPTSGSGFLLGYAPLRTTFAGCDGNWCVCENNNGEVCGNRSLWKNIPTLGYPICVNNDCTNQMLLKVFQNGVRSWKVLFDKNFGSRNMTTESSVGAVTGGAFMSDVEADCTVGSSSCNLILD